MGRKRAEPTASAEHRPEADAIGPPVRWLERSVLTIVQISMSVGRLPVGDEVMPSGALAVQCVSVQWAYRSLERSDAHDAASSIAPHQNGMVAIMLPHIRVSDRPRRCMAATEHSDTPECYRKTARTKGMCGHSEAISGERSIAWA